MSTTTASVEPDLLRARLQRARHAAAAQGADALVIAPGSDLRYLIGGSGSSFERLTALVVPAGSADAVLVVPKLEAPGYSGIPLADLGVRLATWVDGEDPYALVAGALGSPSVVAVGDMLPALHALPLRTALPDAEQVLAGPVLRELRMRKDAAEVEALRVAGAAIDRVHARMAEWLRAGRTEAEVGADIAAAIVAEGHARVEFVIVGSGPNGASPHHSLSDRVIESGDVVVIDIGGSTDEGYNSDSTRVYAVGEPRDADVAETYAVLLAAQRASVESVRPGVTAESVDAVGRQVIADAGFGEYFIHRTGHGIGLDVHEHPYIVAGNDLVLEPGMAFSVEPGIYLPDRWGARIEDIVVVTADGVESVNNQPHELVVLPG
ncbi:M24 family metallopeptidase [Actinokineospora globicatena]|uniref:M24 family metallopeptidase n=1 Tax=Actinokineospora globicatena TaxID=103729 RepID=UPI0020A3D9A1|nr:Xaa-Pro peptidase family protein [Actinokineospora globicatena]MCP2306663.1 Xaa-Pro aminopeptidase [Actinokineospora globicatena]GLW82221.1 dipeptidase [Actinokineospora globicatena]GLW89014.1 dipeptidase [Actinokineospora globicatena]